MSTKRLEESEYESWLIVEFYLFPGQISDHQNRFFLGIERLRQNKQTINRNLMIIKDAIKTWLI